MTVVEYEDRIVVVDTGLMFPAPDQLGIDLVLPDFAYLRERAEDIDAIVLTHGHEDHVGALPYVMRQLRKTGAPDPEIFGGPLTIEMARSKLDEHKIKEVPLDAVSPGEVLEAGPFSLEMVKMAHSIPDAFAVAITCDLGTTLITGDYKFDQTPVDGIPADVARLAELGREGILVLCGDSTNVDRPGRRRLRVQRRAAPGGDVRPLRGPDPRHLLRLQHPPRPAGGGRRRRARPEGRAGRPIDAQEREHRQGAGPHRHP